MYSKFVVLTYLNTSGLDFQGGHTQFYDNNFNKTITFTELKYELIPHGFVVFNISFLIIGTVHSMILTV